MRFNVSECREIAPESQKIFPTIVNNTIQLHGNSVPPYLELSVELGKTACMCEQRLCSTLPSWTHEYVHLSFLQNATCCKDQEHSSIVVMQVPVLIPNAR